MAKSNDDQDDRPLIARMPRNLLEQIRNTYPDLHGEQDITSLRIGVKRLLDDRERCRKNLERMEALVDQLMDKLEGQKKRLDPSHHYPR